MNRVLFKEIHCAITLTLLVPIMQHKSVVKKCWAHLKIINESVTV